MVVIVTDVHEVAAILMHDLDIQYIIIITPSSVKINTISSSLNVRYLF